MWKAVGLAAVVMTFMPTCSLSNDSYEDDEEWQCGADAIGKFLSESQIQLDCPRLKKPINNCCKGHDNCYSDQSGQKYCDDIFCGCIINVTRGSGVCGTEDGPLLCEIVRRFGEGPYLRSANHTSKPRRRRPKKQRQRRRNDTVYDVSNERSRLEAMIMGDSS